MIRVDTVPISLDSMPPALQNMLAPGGPPERRLALAKAALPMDPRDLLTSLAYLSQDKNPDIAQTAADSINQIPLSVLSQAVKIHDNPGTLDRLARAHSSINGLVDLIVANKNAANETIAHIAGSAKGPVLDQIAVNQARILEFPKIVEALYYNSETRMGTVAVVLENAVRMGIDLSHIPGYLEIVESILGPEAANRAKRKEDFLVEEPPSKDEPEEQAQEANAEEGLDEEEG
ncbi:MAG TPA: hypothetical protein P5317_06280, partial [Myxococcota bacterium]|nr:hypothetical protein [Myxococcota bacterium]